MFYSNTVTRASRPHPRTPLFMVISTALLSLFALGSTVPPAQAVTDGDPLLPPAGTCANDSNAGTTWDSAPLQRNAVACLINKVRATYNQANPTAGVKQLSYCNQDRTGCTLLTGLASTRTTLANLTTAAQWKAMNVGYMCNSDNYFETRDLPPRWHIDDPHNACDRPVDYWPAYYAIPRTRTSENLAPGYPNFLRLDAFGRGIPVTPREVVNAWLGSTGHRQNMLDPQAHWVGVGVSPAANAGLTPQGQVGIAPEWGSNRQIYAAQFIS
jgi:hypothetical protein